MKTALLPLLLLVPAGVLAEPRALRDEDRVSHPEMADVDGDGVSDGRDNCRDLFNTEQLDLNRDGQGDACDADDDNDGVTDVADNCPARANVGQADADDDGMGDVCDAHFDTVSTVDLMGVLASRSDAVLASLPRGAASQQRLDAAVAAVTSAAQAWDSGSLSRQSYEASLVSAMAMLTDFDLQLTAQASSGQLSGESAELLFDASGGIRQLVARLYVR